MACNFYFEARPRKRIELRNPTFRFPSPLPPPPRQLPLSFFPPLLRAVHCALRGVNAPTPMRSTIRKTFASRTRRLNDRAVAANRLSVRRGSPFCSLVTINFSDLFDFARPVADSSSVVILGSQFPSIRTKQDADVGRNAAPAPLPRPLPAPFRLSFLLLRR